MNNFFAALYNPDFEFNMICLFKLLKQTGEIYISLHSTTITSGAFLHLNLNFLDQRGLHHQYYYTLLLNEPNFNRFI